MKKIEITLDDELHSKLEETSRKTSKSVDQLIHDLLIKNFKEAKSSYTYSPDLLAEGYQVMAKENLSIAEKSLVAQIVALEKQNETHNGCSK
jgi:metal-responsive CopG/Arc/MetJ family transcriptional regulator